MHDFARYLNIRSAMTPLLSPDERRVAYLTDVTGNYQAWSVGLDGGPAACRPRQLTYLPDKVWDIHGTRQSPYLIADSDTAGNERQQFYRISNYGADAQGRPVYDVVRLTTDDEAIHTFGTWLPDGAGFYYTTNVRNGTDFDIYYMRVADGAAMLVRECTGRRAIMACAPDGNVLLCVDQVSSDQNELYLVDVASGEEQHITAQASPARYANPRWLATGIYLLSDCTHDRGALCRLEPASGAVTELLNVEALDAYVAHATGEFELFQVSPDEQTAALVMNVEGESSLFLCDMDLLCDGDAPAQTLRPVAQLREGVISKLHFTLDGQRVLLDWQRPKQPPDLWQLSVATGALTQVTYSDTTGLDTEQFVSPRLNHFTSFDGLTIPALLYLPQTPAPPQGYPCILYIHGGPAGQQRPDFDVRFQFFLQQGYALLAPNVRGSTGYGRTYMLLDEVEKRMDAVADLEAAVDWLAQQSSIDAQRIAVYGRSYGGFMVLAALTEYPTRFAAGVEEVGIADWVTFLERTSPWRRAHREREYGALAHDHEFLRAISPLHKAERIQAPLMVLAGDNDPRVPLYESQQIVDRVRGAGGTVEFVHYADEGHRFSKLANRIDSFTRIAVFLQQHLR